jgi:hypothetical protein
MNSTFRAFLVYGFTLGMILALVGVTYLNYRYVESHQSGEHFIPRWLGAKAWIQNGESPFQEQVGKDAQQMIYGRPARLSIGEDRYLFLYPLTSMVFLAPFTLFDFKWSLAFWMTLLELCLVSVTLISVRLTRWNISSLKLVILILFSLFWFYSIQTVVKGQYAALNAVWIVLGLLFVMQKQDVLAGVFFALSTTKPTMVILIIPFVCLWAFSTHRNELLWSTILSTMVFLLASLALMPMWPLEWIRQLAEFPEYTIKLSSPIILITDSMPGIQNALNIFLYSLFGIYLLVEWILAWGKEDRWFLWTSMLTILVTNWVGYRTGTANYVLFIPIFIFIFQALDQRWHNQGSILVFLFAIIILTGLWMMDIWIPGTNSESAVMALPVAILCLFGLWWIRWWYVRPPRMMLNSLSSTTF